MLFMLSMRFSFVKNGPVTAWVTKIFPQIHRHTITKQLLFLATHTDLLKPTLDQTKSRILHAEGNLLFQRKVKAMTTGHSVHVHRTTLAVR
jgi:hypothetical protein